MKMGGCKLKAMCHLSSVKGAGKYGSVSEGVHTKKNKKKKGAFVGEISAFFSNILEFLTTIPTIFPREQYRPLWGSEETTGCTVALVY